MVWRFNSNSPINPALLSVPQGQAFPILSQLVSNPPPPNALNLLALNGLPQGRDALNLTGTLEAHSRVFQQVANRHNSVIISRSVGPLVTGLLAEGYATKGFHNKAKSCDWGPAAGFVVTDPWLGKGVTDLGSCAQQQRYINRALEYPGAGETPVRISIRRVEELLSRGVIRDLTVESGEDGHNVWTCSAISRSGVTRRFSLHRTLTASGFGLLRAVNMIQQAADGAPAMAEVGAGVSDNIWRAHLKANEVDVPVMALVGARVPGNIRGTHLAATIGDYDLFAVFPPKTVNPQELVRMVGGSTWQPGIGYDEYAAHESPESGNLSDLIERVMIDVNQLAFYRGGNIVHHSDEAGRPGVTTVEVPLIGWVPEARGERREPYGMRDIDDLVLFLNTIGKYYRLESCLNPGWIRTLVQHGLRVNILYYPYWFKADQSPQNLQSVEARYPP